MPNGYHNGDDGTLVNHPPNAPFESNVLVLHVDLSLRKDVNPIAQIQLIYASVHCGLKDASPSDARDAFAVHKEGRVALLGEADIVSCQCPADPFGAAYIFQWQDAWKGDGGVVTFYSIT